MDGDLLALGAGGALDYDQADTLIIIFFLVMAVTLCGADLYRYRFCFFL